MSRLSIAVVLLGLVVTQQAASGQPSGTFESITYATAALGFTAATIRPAGRPAMTVCRGKLETAQIRVRDDGTAPTASVGQPIDIGDWVEVNGADALRVFQGIRTGGTSGVIQWRCNRQ
jgi:hypothetical protein